VGRYLPPANSFLRLGVYTSVSNLVKIDKEMRPWEWRHTDRQTDTHTHTDWQTQNDFIICPMLYAIAMGQIIIYCCNIFQLNSVTQGAAKIFWHKCTTASHLLIKHWILSGFSLAWIDYYRPIFRTRCIHYCSYGVPMESAIYAGAQLLWYG